MNSLLERIGFFKDERRQRVSKDQFGPYEHSIASSLGGIITIFFVTPLDVAKTRLQTSNHLKKNNRRPWMRHSHIHLSQPPVYRGTIDAFSRIARSEGLFRLWRGISPSIVMTVPTTTLYFTLYEYLKSYTQSKDLGWWGPVISGSVARTIVVAFSSPLELIRTNLQSHGRDVGVIDVFISIHHSGNLKKLWIGLRPTLWRDVPFSAIYWSILEGSRNVIFDFGIRYEFITNFICGAAAGTVASIITMPFDVIKTRIQMNVDLTTSKAINPYKGKTVFEVAREISKQEGRGSIFRGALPRASKVAPACAIMISTYEYIK